ncbi:uncharacterized protein I303_102554 [Kwoniella dejecticola CBS 10117]|uniref:Maintenance of mitochondrial morphology protein 1 n=1 Tax=Kwoniella dejecticola CBS 10117 TaxID=1296121 RepID=A0A1A6A922_9TREE|nr:mitochondrial outer membrane protein [Kwoniella dejecticola CBS 10117]OBR86560.1 mitochondrial outer membrane protein [Kwoniella dejecticola CBS 10117]
MSNPPLPPALAPIPPSTSSWTFTQGFILGQASFLVIILLFVRYVVFSPSEELDTEGWRQKRAEKAKKALLSTTSVPPPPPAQLLQKTNYEMATHAAESTDWVNVLLAQVLQGYRNDLLSANGEEGARQRIEKWLNPVGSNLSWLDPIEVTSLSLGKAYPLLSNARIRPADGQGRIRAEIDVDYLDSISLSLSTAVLVNFPRPRFAVLPVSLGVELVSIGGTLSVQLHQPIEERQHIHVSLLPDFHLNLKITSLLGSRAKLQDIPKLEQLILSRLRSVIQDRFVYPAHLSLALPRILSPSVSPTPVLNDLGESAVNAMSEAMSQGISRMVNDMMGPVLPSDMGSTTVDDNETDTDHDLFDPVDEEAMMRARAMDREEGLSTPTIPGGLGGGRKKSIPIPANLASSTSGSIERPRSTRPPYLSTQTRPTTPSITSSYRQNPVGESANGNKENQFRFRGQFASNPPTPGIGDRKDGLGVMEGGRKLGVLNSRA